MIRRFANYLVRIFSYNGRKGWAEISFQERFAVLLKASGVGIAISFLGAMLITVLGPLILIFIGFFGALALLAKLK